MARDNVGFPGKYGVNLVSLVEPGRGERRVGDNPPLERARFQIAYQHLWMHYLGVVEEEEEGRCVFVLRHA